MSNDTGLDFHYIVRDHHGQVVFINDSREACERFVEERNRREAFTIHKRPS